MDFCYSADERQTAPVVAVAIGGGSKTFNKAGELLTPGTAVLAFSKTGGAADFMAEAYYKIKHTANTLVL